MTPLEYLTEARSDYVAAFRRTLRQRRDEDPGVQCEVWVTRDAEPGSDEPASSICIDILGGSEGEPTVIAVSSQEPPEGALVGALRMGHVPVKVYPVTWEMFVVWLRHAKPDWSMLDPWRAKWLDPHRGADAEDEDGLSGCAHYLGTPVAEGGGYLLEVDFGTAAIEALTELLKALVRGGATEIELGRSDGSDLGPTIAAELRRPDLSSEHFAQLLARLLAEFEEFERAEVIRPEEISVYRKGESEPHTVFTSNLFMRIQRVGPEARAKEVYRFCRGQREIGFDDDSVPDLSQLRPVIKDDRFLENVREQTDGKMNLLARKLVADLWVCCVWDSPNGMRFASADEPSNYGLTAEQMHDRAVQNFLDHREDVEFAEHGPLIVARTGDSYDATLLLDDAFWSEMAGKVDGDVLACVPARDFVLIAGSKTPGAVASLRTVADRISEGGDHLVTETILRRTGDRWTALTPPETSAGATHPATSQAKKPWWKFW